jgi:hypothetical protein
MSNKAGDFSTIKSGHHIFFEAEQDLDSSILLMLSGFYKDSIRAMRSCLELNIFALYNFLNEGEYDFQRWLSGESKTPKLHILLDGIINKSDAFKKLDTQMNWKEEVKLLYKELSGFMHTQGASYTHVSLRNSNQTVFSSDGIKVGMSLLIKVIRISGMGFVVNFPMSMRPLPMFEKFAFSPPVGGFLDAGQVENIKSIFDEDVSSKLSQICLEDEFSHSLSEGVISMKDLSEEEVSSSLKDFLQSKGFEGVKEEILVMIKEGEMAKAMSMSISIQRAAMRALNGLLFSPFYANRPKR